MKNPGKHHLPGFSRGCNESEITDRQAFIEAYDGP